MYSFDLASRMNRRILTKIAAANVAVGMAIAHQLNAFAQAPSGGHAVKVMYAFAPLEDGKLTTCLACRRHAANKRFATLEAARANRAHSGCRCAIYGIAVPDVEHAQMFGDAIERELYDLRWRDRG